MEQSIIFISIACLLSLSVLFYKYRTGVVFRIGISIAIIAAYSGLTVDFFNYSHLFLGDLYEVFIIIAVILGIILVFICGLYLSKTIIKPINRLI